MDLSIVIINWNVIEVLKGCLDSLRRHLTGVRYEVILIDNASSDGSQEIIKRDYPWVRLIENKTNVGVAPANNQGVRVSQGRYVLFLNPDTVIMPNSLQALMKTLDENDTIGICGPRLTNANGQIDLHCKRASPNLLNVVYRRFLIEKIVYALVERIAFFKKIFVRSYYRSGPAQGVSGACLLVRKRDLDLIGSFDERVPMYLEDIDLCYRFLKRGFTIYYDARVEVIHLGGKSTQKTGNKLLDIVSIQAEGIFFLKYFNPLYIIAYRSIIFLSSLFWFIIDLILFPLCFITGRSSYICSVLQKHFFLIGFSLTGVAQEITRG